MEDYKQLLIKKREEIQSLLQAGRDGARPVELDQTTVGRLSRMDAMQVQAMALAEKERRRKELERIEAALERIENGEYGDCATCGEPIAPKRLELNPACRTCIACASGDR